MDEAVNNSRAGLLEVVNVNADDWTLKKCNACDRCNSESGLKRMFARDA